MDHREEKRDHQEVTVEVWQEKSLPQIWVVPQRQNFRTTQQMRCLLGKKRRSLLKNGMGGVWKRETLWTTAMSLV